MKESIDNYESKYTEANIISGFKFGQEVWFINDNHVMNGTVEGVRGSKCPTNYETELNIYYSSGELGANFWVKHEYCYKSKQELVDKLLDV